jgi:hypothetical protein
VQANERDDVVAHPVLAGADILAKPSGITRLGLGDDVEPHRIKPHAGPVGVLEAEMRRPSSHLAPGR